MNKVKMCPRCKTTCNDINVVNVSLCSRCENCHRGKMVFIPGLKLFNSFSYYESKKCNECGYHRLDTIFISGQRLHIQDRRARK